ncbi:MAG: aromatic-ring-hydroxylating dioxygenase subunit beta [Bacteroidota bacterium]
MAIDAAAQRAIEQLVYEWARTVDEGRLEDLAGLLIEDGEYKVASRYNADRGLPLAVIHTRSRGQLRDRITSLRVANIYEAHCYRHLVSGVQVIGEADGAFEVRSNYVVIRIMEHDGASSVFSTGQYRDGVVFEGGTPRFRRRHVVFDSKAIDTLLVYPL